MKKQSKKEGAREEEMRGLASVSLFTPGSPRSLCPIPLVEKPSVLLVKDGGPDRDRTGDLLNAIQARSQLRYRPIFAGCRALIVTRRAGEERARRVPVGCGTRRRDLACHGPRHLLIRLFQHATTGSVRAWRARRFRRISASFHANSPPKRLVRTPWRRVAGRTVLRVPGAGMRAAIDWSSSGAGNVRRVGIRYR